MNPNQSTFEALWGLDEPLRLPVSHTGWEALPSQIRSIGEFPEIPRPFAAVIPSRDPSRTVGMVASLIEAAPEDFIAVSAAISPEGWRQLYYRGTYVLDCLTSPRFHADQALRSICEQRDAFEDPPDEWLGTSSRPEDVAADTAYALRQVGRELSMAAWAILSAAQAFPLSKAEILHCKWWDPDWVQSLSRYLNSK